MNIYQSTKCLHQYKSHRMYIQDIHPLFLIIIAIPESSAYWNKKVDEKKSECIVNIYIIIHK